ncbi:MAG: hypothetical protein ACI9HK_001669 [Pirellulaceae bacterium]|jgi:hypothetical protein
MAASNSKSLPSFGFVTIDEHQQHGLFGGYLILNVHGRPLEFHCTAPVKPNRAQEILYGPTLKPFLYGEQIAHTLVSKARIQPQIICTDVQEVLAVADLIEMPAVLVFDESNDGNSSSPIRTSDLSCFRILDLQVAVHRSKSAHQQQVTDILSGLAENTDLCEPFSRIRDALNEAQTTAKAA